jgi:Beta-galactosidase
MRICLFLCLMLALLAVPAWSGEISLPSHALDRDTQVPAIYRTHSKGTGKGELTVRWNDVYGRLVEDRKIPFRLTNGSEVTFKLDLRRAVAMRNHVTVHFSFEGVDRNGSKDRREEDADASFVARPADRTWWDYQIIMWQEHSAQHYAVLKSLGISAGMYRGQTETPPEYLLSNDLRWYVENIATDFYSEYHRSFLDRPKNWKFLAAKELYRKDTSSKDAFKRNPSLSDPEWLQKIRDQLVNVARMNSTYRPLFYNLGDESGIADLSAFWDFNFSDHSIAEMRTWLKERYGTLAALNHQWGSTFPSWDTVTPETTNEAMKRTDHNFSSWSDFKEWMDVAFARALKMGSGAIHSVDPNAYVAIEGGQVPGWGGYDYSRLTGVLDAIEPDGSILEIIRSLNAKMVMFTTSFEQGSREKRRVWSDLLRGSRGLILWDAKSEYVGRDGMVGPRGRDAESYFKELRRGIGAVLINSQRQPEPIAIHYSQPSMRTEWMLEQKQKGEAWTGRSASSEEDSSVRWLRESYCRLIEDLGRQYTFVASDRIERGGLLRSGYRVLILPHSTALSEAEAQAMRQFVVQGGVLIADGNPGAYDAHSRRLSRPYLSELFAGPHVGPTTVRTVGRGKAIYVNMDLANYHRDRVLGRGMEGYRVTGRVLRENLAEPEFILGDTSGDPVVGVAIHVFRNGGARIVGLVSNPANQRVDKAQAVVLTFPGGRFAYNLRTAEPLGKEKRLTVQVDPYEPTILSVSPAAMPRLIVSGPRRLRLGETGEIGLRVSGRSPAALHVFHVDVVDPSGEIASRYSGNISAPNGHAATVLPLALNDKPGKWKIRVQDLLSGQAHLSTVDVFE